MKEAEIQDNLDILLKGMPITIKELSEVSPIFKSTREAFFYSFVNNFLGMSGYDGFFSQQAEEPTKSYLQYWLQVVKSKLKEASGEKNAKSVEDVWQDNVLNVVLQMLDRRMIDEKTFQTECDEISDYRTRFLESQGINEEKANAAREVLNSEIKVYKEKEIDTTAVMQRILEAYQTVYLYEFMSGKQTTSQIKSTRYSEFILRQSPQILYSKGVIKSKFQIDSIIAIKRAMQDLTAKKITPILDGELSKANCKVISYEEPSTEDGTLINYRDFDRRDALFNKCKAICYEPPSIRAKNLGLGAFDKIAREIEYTTSQIALINKICNDFHRYMDYKNHIAGYYIPAIEAKGYENTYLDNLAHLKGIMAQIQAIHDFPIKVQLAEKGSTKGQLDDSRIPIELGKFKTEMQGVFGNLLNSSLEYKDEKTIVETFDDIIKTKGMRKVKNNWTLNVGNFIYIEYNEDGTAKSYSQILADQLEAMRTESGEPTNSDPTESIDQLAIRLQIIMYRASAYGQEAECVDAINSFLSQNQEMLGANELLSKLFPNGKVPEKADTNAIYEECMKNNDFHVAELAFNIDAIQGKIMKRNFAAGVMNKCYEKAIGTPEIKVQQTPPTKTLPEAPTIATSTTMKAPTDISNAEESTFPYTLD